MGSEREGCDQWVSGGFNFLFVCVWCWADVVGWFLQQRVVDRDNFRVSPKYGT